ncbi:MAG TPA: hypothetical protein PK322_07800, partial [Opitutaceae bacterium]|nr:hypothetical protein [Opitutaceae bacterium]
MNTRSAKALLGVELGSERHQQPERLRDGGAVFLAVVVGDDLLIAPVVAHRERIRRHHVGEVSAVTSNQPLRVEIEPAT